MTNNERADQAAELVDSFCRWSGQSLYEDGHPEVIGDLICELLHLCRRDGVDPDVVLKAARFHYRAERTLAWDQEDDGL